MADRTLSATKKNQMARNARLDKSDEGGSEKTEGNTAKRFPVDFSPFQEILIILLAYLDGTGSKAQKVREIVVAELSKPEVRTKMHDLLSREARSKGITVDEHIRSILQQEKMADVLETEFTPNGNLELLLLTKDS